MNARTILHRKGGTVYTISPTATIREAMAMLIRYRIGSLMVLDNQSMLLGMITDKDIFRLTYEHEGKIMGIRVDAIMNREPVCAYPEDSVVDLKTLFTENRIRQLPILERGRLMGIISIGDVIREESREMDVENRYLKTIVFGAADPSMS